jgi:hypothetical protein
MELSSKTATREGPMNWRPLLRSFAFLAIVAGAYFLLGVPIDRRDVATRSRTEVPADVGQHDDRADHLISSRPIEVTIGTVSLVVGLVLLGKIFRSKSAGSPTSIA